MEWMIRATVVLAALLIASGIAVYSMMTGSLPLADAGVMPGSQMPGFRLTDQNGKEHHLEEYRGKIVVLVFSSQKCPFSRGADKQLIELTKQYRENSGVVFLGIDSHYQTAPEDIAGYAKERGLIHPILKDVDNRYADKTGAKVTPEIYIVDREGKLAYRGAFDNRSGPDSEGTTPYTANAIKALLNDEPVENPRIKAWGCSIKRK